jgi:hypothetical protein
MGTRVLCYPARHFVTSNQLRAKRLLSADGRFISFIIIADRSLSNPDHPGSPFFTDEIAAGTGRIRG